MELRVGGFLDTKRASIGEVTLNEPEEWAVEPQLCLLHLNDTGQVDQELIMRSFEPP